MAPRPWVTRIFWIDGIAGLSAGTFVLAARSPLADLHALPLALITFIGLVNVAYSGMGLTLAVMQRRRFRRIVGLAVANGLWALVCGYLAIRFWKDASPFGLTHLLFEGAFVTALATV